jgi:hypothetical protein
MAVLALSFELQHLACFRRRCDVNGQFVEDATDLANLFRVRRSKFALAKVNAVSQSYAHRCHSSNCDWLVCAVRSPRISAGVRRIARVESAGLFSNLTWCLVRPALKSVTEVRCIAEVENASNIIIA